MAAIVVVVVVVFAGAGVLSAQGTLRAARHSARRDATSQAALAAQAVASSWALAQTQVASLAGNPGLVQVLADPSTCRLTFALDLFPHGHLDVLRPDGTVACSSLSPSEMPPVATQAGEPWLTALLSARSLTVSTPSVDRLTGSRAVVIGAPIMAAGGKLLGAIALVAPVGDMSDKLAANVGGPQHYLFAVTDSSTGAVLASPTALTTGSSPQPTAPNPILATHLLSGSAPIPTIGWRVYAGVPSAVALGATRAILIREGELGAAALLLILVLLAVVQRRVTRPLQRLTAVVGDTGPHVQGVLAGVGGTAEVARLAARFQEMIAARDSYENELSHQALHDLLTGLPNRALLVDRLANALAQVGPGEQPVAVLFFDIDHFKQINDSLGHAAGDSLLVMLSARLETFVRPGDTVARFGGDEFVLVSATVPGPVEATTLAGRLGDLVAEPFEVSDRIIRVSCSIGVALGTAMSRAEDVIRDADTAMYAAKESGRACHKLFDDKLREHVTARMTMENELQGALVRQELRLVYQPKVDLETGATVGVEALLRWEHPALGSIPPVAFIPVAEETGLIVPIGAFVLKSACDQAADWHRQGFDISVAVNVSGRQLADAALADQLAEILATTGLRPDRLCLELTESMLMSDAARTVSTLGSLKRLGISLSIDDFGTGYSSLAYLQRFPVDELKVDRTFVNDMSNSVDGRILVAAIISMGKALGLRVVAEGVETSAQATQLRLLGCHQAQGYLFAKPQTADAITVHMTDGIRNAVMLST